MQHARTASTIVAFLFVGTLPPGAAGQTRPAGEGPPVDIQKAFFRKQPRLMYGTCIIPSNENQWGREADEKGLDLIRAMGGTHIWLNMNWSDIERTAGQLDFSYHDFLVGAARERGLEVMAVLIGTPVWALPPEVKGRDRIRHRCPPQDRYKDAFINFHRSAAQRYRGKIKYYQFWNEPNGCFWVNEGCRNSDQYPVYTKWLKIAYPVLKAADPDCLVAAGALDYHDGVTRGYEYLEGMYREGAKGYFDAFSIHPYAKKMDRALHVEAIRDTRRVLVAHGDWRVPMWITEYGWSTPDEDLKARLLEEALTQLTGPEFFYITMACYLSLTDPPGEKGYGLCEQQPLKPRKAYEVHRALAKDKRPGKFE